MPRPADFFRYVIALSSLLAFAAHAQGRAANMEESEVQRWLRMIPLAAQSLDYSGTFAHRQGSQVYTSRITHIVQDGKELEKLEVIGAPPREYVRKNEEVVYYAPDHKVIRVEQRATPEGFPALLFQGPEQLLPFYRLQLGVEQKVAGLDCQELLLLPRDNFRYGYRLCVEKNSGLLLQFQTMIDNQAIEQIGFTRLKVGNISPELVRASHADVQDWRHERGMVEQMEMPRLQLGFVPPGFRPIATVRHLPSHAATVAGRDAERAGKEREKVQIVFSDGLAAISVFMEPGLEGRSESLVQQGAVTMMNKRIGDFWLTIVGEIPAAAVRKIAHSIEFKSHQ